ncbi:hypothetical protein [Flavobacterium cyclinae]|uniref:hypothetical protein n=1 Tax=Flavobacterium cyclinae TaxID=2895947 RepID=UPI001E2FCB8F|nr:hypothetical protein [Flavobacterium cyclinae]UGS21822.1 hypothetical protein LOS86_04135 [Flavobacterium cyclinae]
MELFALEFKDYNHITLKNVIDKQIKIKDQLAIKLSLDELKSVLSVFFSIQFHFNDSVTQDKKLYKKVIFEDDDLVNITRDFGRQLLENLDGFKKEELLSLANQDYDMNMIFKNDNLDDFVERNLISDMNFRSIEYGRFFLKNFSTKVLNFNEHHLNSIQINDALKKDKYPLKTIAKQITDSNSNLSTQEGLLLSFVLDEYLFKTNINALQLGLVSFIVKENMYKLSDNLNIYGEVLNKSLNKKWKLNRGLGI